MKPKLIGLFSRVPQCGKTSVGNRLELKHGFSRIPMAETLKRMMRIMILEAGASQTEIEELERGNKEYPFCDLTPTTLRKAYQTLGTEWGRNHIHPDIWVNIWARKVSEQISVWGESVVCDDMRFENEFIRLKSMGGEMWLITKGDDRNRPAHASESYDPPESMFDQIIYNTSTFEDLHHLVDMSIA